MLFFKKYNKILKHLLVCFFFKIKYKTINNVSIYLVQTFAPKSLSPTSQFTMPVQTQSTTTLMPTLGSRFTQNLAIQAKKPEPQLFSQLNPTPRQNFDSTILKTNQKKNFNTNNIQLNRRIDQAQRNKKVRNENQAKLNFERRLQEKDQQLHILFWQNHQS